MVIVGALAGAVGGIVLLVLRGMNRGSELARGIIVGAILFVSSCLLAWISGKIAFGVSSIQLLTLGVVAIIFLVYGVCAAVLLTRFERSLGERG